LLSSKDRNENYRRTILRKNLTDKQIYETVDLLKKYKIRICTYNIFALPGETVDQALMTIAMNQKIKPYVAISSIFHPFPGIDLTIKSIDENILNFSDTIDTKVQKMATVATSIIQPEIKQVMNLAKLSSYAIHYPILMPIIKRLILLPPNFIFNSLFYLDHLIRSIKLFKVSILTIGRALFKYIFCLANPLPGRGICKG
jgi:anaerobic magnesium-protoporphyrin IX monomethyl ester cyclase